MFALAMKKIVLFALLSLQLAACSEEEPQSDQHEERSREAIEQDIKDGGKPKIKNVSDVAGETFYLYFPQYADTPVKVLETGNLAEMHYSCTLYYGVCLDQMLSFYDNKTGHLTTIAESFIDDPHANSF